MAYIEPVTNWKTRDIPAASDFNRIEGNIDAIVNDAMTMLGTKTFSDDILVDTIDDISGNGITLEGINIKNGVISGILWGA